MIKEVSSLTECTVRVPPWASIMLDDIARPNPTPLDLFVTKGGKIVGRMSSVMGLPLFQSIL